MKKFLLCVLLLTIPSGAYAKSYLDAQLKKINNNVRYNSVQTYKRNYTPAKVDISTTPIIKEVYDPKLLKLVDYNKIDETKYDEKIKQDELVYKNQIIPVFNKKISNYTDEPLSVDFYKIYRISEKLIRANNLDYVNWRIAIRKTEESNASSTDVNYIEMNTGLYDSFYNNDDALAFILAHEMAHLILGHQKQMGEILTKLDRAEDLMKSCKSNRELAAYYTNKAKVIKYYNDFRDMEYMADAEAIILLTKAGYSPRKAVEVLKYFDNFAHVKTLHGLYETHPDADKRITSFNQNMAVINPEWVEEGKENIYNTKVLGAKKSSDRVSFVIDKSENVQKFYEVENMEQRLERIAYMSYLNGNFQNATKYFDKLTDMDNNNYVYHIYLALANKGLYDSLKEEKYLKRAEKSIEKASSLRPGDEVIKTVKNMIR